MSQPANVAETEAPQTSHDEGFVSAAPSRPMRRHLSWWLFYLLAWPCVLALVVVAGLKIFYFDGTYLLMSINAFTRYLYLPAYACLVWAAWQRRWILATAALFVVACHLRWVAPDFVRDSRFDVPATTSSASAPADSATQESKPLRIFFANVCVDNDDPSTFLDEIAVWDPDVVLFVEFYPATRTWFEAVQKHRALSKYAYGTGRTMDYVTEIGIFSKLPVEHPKQFWTAGRLNMPFDIHVDGRPLRLFVLHSPRPMVLPLHDYDGFWKKTLPQLFDQPDPTIVVGDFNSTQYSLVYQKLTAERYRSAHEDRGRGYATTWPNGNYPIPPIRIDQALLSPGVECVNIQEGVGHGSDHKPLILDVRLRPSTGSQTGGTP